MHRRTLLKIMALASAWRSLNAATTTLPEAPEKGFDYAWLKGQARSLAAQAYDAHEGELPQSLLDVSYAQYQLIRYRPDHSLWHGEKRGLEVRFFHPGFIFKRPVHLFEVQDGSAKAIAYDPAAFDFSKSGVDGSQFSPDIGYAGFRVIDETNPEIDVAAFLGASYFRAVGAEKQYGMSVRGLAIDTGAAHPEEFPYFTHFWLERPPVGGFHLVIYALLDSPSCSGAYRIEMVPGEHMVMDVDAAIYPRQTIERLGIAPLTSMYQTGENDKRLANDIRPEIHDSDGLAMWTGNGEWIWRPLENPRHLRYNHYSDRTPRGFGLLQRDRNFDHYQDDGVFYERRPGVWVEPKGDWGAGGVVLVELPTADETFDNIVAFWQPQTPPTAGDEVLYAYRLYWGHKAPVTPHLATVAATRTGIGGVVGNKREKFSWRFAIDFAGGKLPLLAHDARVDLKLELSRGSAETTSCRPLDAIKGYRAIFDLVPDESTDPINLKLYLEFDGVPLSETWVYQYSPPPLEERRF
jgi:glucans biosynthesis protein